ncbi:MAG: hypothetical protein HDT28_04975 [Clostridiales bacterium]|nr:hypothetical protein [Clostridiales bacterium]
MIERFFLDYQVAVRRNDGEILDRDKVIKGIGLSTNPARGFFSFLGYTSIGRKILTDTVLYQTDYEELALSVYGEAKRNLDPRLYAVTLEFHWREMRLEINKTEAFLGELRELLRKYDANIYDYEEYQLNIQIGEETVVYKWSDMGCGNEDCCLTAGNIMKGRCLGR